MAIDDGNVAKVKSLLELGCKSHINTQDSEGNTALHVLVLDPSGCDTQKKRKEKFHFFNPQEDTKRRLELCELLLDAGADPSLQNRAYETPLHRAVIANNVAVVERLVSAKVDVNVCDQNGWTALHFAALEGYHDIVKVLLEAKADIAICNLDEHETALHLAVKSQTAKSTRASYRMPIQRSKAGIVKMLLNANSDILWCRNKRGLTALHIAANTGEECLVKALSEAEKARIVNISELRQDETPTAKRKRGDSSSHSNIRNPRITD
jgi:ankyrin repeat protein